MVDICKKPDMERKSIPLLAFFCNLFFQLFSQGPPITVETPIMLGLEGSGIRTFGRYISTEKSNDFVQVTAFPYNLSPTFQVGGVLPFVFKNPAGAGKASGLGDLTVFTKYQLYKKDGKARTFRVLGRLAHTFPTGRTSGEPPLGAGLQQTNFGLIGGHISPKIGIYGDVGYNLTDKGATDNMVYNFSIGIPLLPHRYPQKQVNAYLELNGNYLLEPRTNQVFLAPGLQFIPGRRLLIESSFQQPVFQKEGAVNKINFRWLLGLRFLIS